MKTINSLLFTLILSVTFSFNISAQVSSVDPSFNSVSDKILDFSVNFITQPDNKLIIFDSSAKSSFVRLNPDGSLDTTFSCTTCNFFINSAIYQPDGKIIVAGRDSADTYGSAIINRLNADGSRDFSFTSPFLIAGPPQIDNAVVVAAQPGGKTLVIRTRQFSVGTAQILSRLNADGTIDNTFATLVVTGLGGASPTTFTRIALLPSGQILIATGSSNESGGTTTLSRYNSDGVPDSTFESPTFQGEFGTVDQGAISDFDVQTDGSVIIGGRFTSVNGINRLNVVKLLPTGNVDLSFNSTVTTNQVNKIRFSADGKVLLSANNQLYRLNSNGSFDNTFTSPANLSQIHNWEIDSAGRIVLSGTFTVNGAAIIKLVRLQTNGSIDSSFSEVLGLAGKITAIAVQADSKVIFTGIFDRINGVISRTIARVNADGSTDQTFNPITIFNTPATKILVQPDGKILVSGGSFNSNGVLRYGIIRFNADGSVDSNFNPNITANLPSVVAVETFALQTDGKIIIAGRFDTVSTQIRTGIARLNSNGNLDTSFNPTFENGNILSVSIQSDGRMLVGGTFSGVNGFSRTNLVRLNATGSLDNSFNAGSISSIKQIEALSNGKYLALTDRVVRLNNDGTIDSSFTSPSGLVYQFLAQLDRTILIGGAFSSINNGGHPNLARLKPNGDLDAVFLPNGANNAVRAFARQPDGRVLVGGDFTTIGGVNKIGIARLIIGPFEIPPTPFDFDGDRKADISLFRPSNGTWYILPSQTGGFYGFPFGQASDQIAPADYDGDGKTDVAVFRPVVPGAGDQSYFYILNSSDNSFRAVAFGTNGDVPMAGDWDGDGKADLAVYRSAATTGGQSNFLCRPSSQPNINLITIQLGLVDDKPLYGDFDGDGKLDAAVFRHSTATFIILKSSLNQIQTTAFGLSTDVPVPADYDGDGITNIAVFRPSTGFWFTNQNPAINYGAIQFGADGDVPVPADYDGDGRADTAVFRPTNGGWFLNRTTNGLAGVQFGINGDEPAPNAYIR